MRKIATGLLIIAVLFQSLGSVYALNDTGSISDSEQTITRSLTKISDELLEEFETGADTYKVMIWTDDIDYSNVERTAERATGMTFAEIESAEDEVYKEAVSEVALSEIKEGVLSPLSIKAEDEIMQDSYEEVLKIVSTDIKPVQEDVNNFISAKRTAAKDMYADNNKVLSENEIIKNNIEFVSKYSPMVIAELTQEEIEELAEDDDVLGIYFVRDEEVSYDEIEYDDDINSEENGQSAIETDRDASVMATTDYDYYLEYLNVDTVHCMGYTGEGVKVGLLDSKVVDDGDHIELNNSNIVSLNIQDNEDANPQTEYHGVNMARIIAGTYGVAPDCEIYSAYFDDFYQKVELLIDQGVSVINMSFGRDRDKNYYTEREMWLDHVMISHSISVVKSAGNTGGNISDPGLTYNVITVGNVNCRTDEVAPTSSYINGSTGAMKPDVASAGKYVLNNSAGGTSSAAATVTGIIALLLEYAPSLSEHPNIVKAIMIASADHVAGSTSFASGYDVKQGAGVVNALRVVLIASRNLYFSNNISSNGTYSRTVSVVQGGNKTSFVLVGTKMNVMFGNCDIENVNNQDMPTTQLVVFNSSNIVVGGCGMPYSSVQLVRGNYTAGPQIRINVSNIGTRGMPYAVAWY